MAAPASLPASPTNRHADDDQAARLGFLMFYDGRFSDGHNTRCASCHAPETNFHDNDEVAFTLGKGTRNTPTVLDAARRAGPFFWDGRADVLWAPPILALENPIEMNFTRLEIAHSVAAFYRDDYQPIFGPLPPLEDAARFPAVGKPGDPAFDAMAPEDQDAINTVAANVGKSFEAYLRKLATGSSPFDRFLAGDRSALTSRQQQGMKLFLDSGCTSCHSGPLLADGAFHNLGVPAQEGVPPDRGRADGLELERAQLFSSDGPYADTPVPRDLPEPTDADLGAIRTPTLRNVSITPPYMHNGRFATVREAVSFHLQGGGAAAIGQIDPLLVPVELDEEELDALVDFLSSLKGTYPQPPWNDWPDTP
jgi:cytochrome c peroxidase